MTGACFRELPRAQQAMIALLAVAVAAANIDQPYPELAPLQHAPTVAVMLASPWLLRRWPLSNRSVACIFAFLLLHTLGGRYIYSYVPYDAWLRAVAGHDISSAFGWRRNGYDRLVHFAFGLLLTLPFAEMTQRHGGASRRMATMLAFALIGLVSALYEIFEWALTILAAGDTAEHYNGQQGDIWDAQKDMAAAIMGSLGVIAYMMMTSAANRLRGF
jgi:putative membrane protein